jgi:hypothetical protein
MIFDDSIGTLTLDGIVTLDSIIAFDIPVVALLTASSLMWHKECL